MKITKCCSSKNDTPLGLNAFFFRLMSFCRLRIDRDCAVRQNANLPGSALLRRPNSSGDVGLRDSGGRAAHLVLTRG